MRKTEEERETAAEERKQAAEERLAKVAKLELTPQEIAEAIRYWVVGQDPAVEAVSVMLHQHIATRVRRAYSGLPVLTPVRIPPILLIGGTGAGKTTLLRALARVSSLPYTHHDASMASEIGWYGQGEIRMCLPR